jgi:DNA-binding transcriptional regulator LsrR (DeoR family)
MNRNSDGPNTRLDDAARAGWLYYVAGNTQDQIAEKLGISRQSAQRLVSLSVSEGLIKMRLDHPIGRCMELAQRLKDKYSLLMSEVVPSDPSSESSTLGIAEAVATEMERWFKRTEPIVVAVGTGRTLKSAVEQLMPRSCPQHRVVSLTGNISADGSAAFYNVIFNITDRVKVRSFPMPMPVIASSARERELLHSQPMVRDTLSIAAQANVSFVGLGDLSPDAPLFLDGFITQDELTALQQAGAVGEICGWTFDAQGQLIVGLTNTRVASAPMPSCDKSQVIVAASGKSKLAGLRAALANHLVNGIITNESTAEQLLIQN